MKIKVGHVSELSVATIPIGDTHLEIEGDGTAKIADDVVLPQITELTSYYCSLRFKSGTFPNLKELRFLHLDSRKSMLSVLPELKKITSLGIGPCNDPEFLPQITSPDLKRLNISGGKIQTLDGIAAHKSLSYVRLHNLDRLTDIGELGKLRHLEKLDVVWCSRLVDFDILNRITSLTELCIFGCRGFDAAKYQGMLHAMSLTKLLI